MKKQLIAVILGAATLLWSNDAFSYKKETNNAPQHGGSTQASNSEAKGANCAPATAQLT